MKQKELKEITKRTISKQQWIYKRTGNTQTLEEWYFDTLFEEEARAYMLEMATYKIVEAETILNELEER